MGGDGKKGDRGGEHLRLWRGGGQVGNQGCERGKAEEQRQQGGNQELQHQP